MSAVTQLPTLVRARKLLAIIDPASNAAATEREFAQIRLEQLMAETGLTLDDLVDAPRTERVLIIEPDFLIVAANIARWIANDTAIQFDAFPHIEEKRSNSKRKAAKQMMSLHAWLSDREAKDWFPACEYYQSLWRENRQNLQNQLKSLRQALKHLGTGMIYKFHLHGPPTDKPTGKLTPAQVAAIQAAMKASQGQQWHRPAGDLADAIPALKSHA